VNTFDIGATILGENFQVGVNYFISRQFDIISQDQSVSPAIYNNIGEIEHQGWELEGKYYVTGSLLLTASGLYQINKDKDGNENVAPLSNWGAKGGISYNFDNSFIISLFDIYQGDLDNKYNTQLNPSPGAYNIMNLHSRLNLKELFNWNLKQEFTLLLQADNLFDNEIWLPNWGIPLGYSIPVNSGRTLYFGVEASLN
jgi:outer membrane receptor protein involved in Fe transport